MRTKFLKIGLPAMAFLAAGVFAFATEKNEAPTEAFVTGYIFQNGQCVTSPKDCNQEGSILCTTDAGEQVYRDKLGATSCDVQMYHRP